MDRARASELLDAFTTKKVLVVGDVILDRYVEGSVHRISPEAPVPVVHVAQDHSQPGGAANVAVNIRSLGGQVSVAGLIGNDHAGENLRALLSERSVNVDNLVVGQGGQTTVKTRVVAERQQVVRVDREDGYEVVQRFGEELAARVGAAARGVDGIIIEDYGKGAVSQDVVNVVLSTARTLGIPVALDPKDNHDLTLSEIALATPNYREACAAAGVPERPLSDDPLTDTHLSEAGAGLQAKWDPDLLIITLGPKGMYLLPRQGGATVIPTKAREVYDVSGAGDTVIATAFLALLAGASHDEAASLANHAAGVVVAKLGTAMCDPAELIESVD